jgi:hypothetical protein
MRIQALEPINGDVNKVLEDEVKSFVNDFIPESTTTNTEEKEGCIKCHKYFDCDHKKCKFSKMNEELHRPICTARDAVGIICWCDCGAFKPIE